MAVSIYIYIRRDISGGIPVFVFGIRPGAAFEQLLLRFILKHGVSPPATEPGDRPDPNTTPDAMPWCEDERAPDPARAEPPARRAQRRVPPCPRGLIDILPPLDLLSLEVDGFRPPPPRWERRSESPYSADGSDSPRSPGSWSSDSPPFPRALRADDDPDHPFWDIGLRIYESEDSWEYESGLSAECDAAPAGDNAQPAAAQAAPPAYAEPSSPRPA